MQPEAVFLTYRFKLNADEYFKMIRLNNVFGIGFCRSSRINIPKKIPLPSKNLLKMFFAVSGWLDPKRLQKKQQTKSDLGNPFNLHNFKMGLC